MVIIILTPCGDNHIDALWCNLHRGFEVILILTPCGDITCILWPCGATYIDNSQHKIIISIHLTYYQMLMRMFYIFVGVQYTCMKQFST